MALFVAFATERFPPVTVAVCATGIMIALGWITPRIITASFANPAPITIAAFFILSGALVRTGTIEALGSGIVRRAGNAPWRTVAGILGGGATAFINNTPVVIVLIPLVRRLAHAIGTPATRLLIPLSYISILGASQLQGELTIDSTPGQGTTADLWLPISAVAVEEDGQTYSAATAHNVQGMALLVDDEDLVRMSTADMLMDLGYDVVEAQSAEEALRLLDDGLHIDIVVTDHLMPGLSGVDLAQALRSSRPDLPVLIVSGYAEVDGIAPNLPRLTKPFRSTELVAKLATPAAVGK